FRSRPRPLGQPGRPGARPGGGRPRLPGGRRRGRGGRGSGGVRAGGHGEQHRPARGPGAGGGHRRGLGRLSGAGAAGRRPTGRTERMADGHRGRPLDGRTALVTGGAGGIGRAVCAALAAAGARTLVADVDGAGAERTAAALPGAAGVRIDLADPEDVAAGVDRVRAAAAGGVDVLVHNAGVSVIGPFCQSDPADWDLMWRVNARAPMQVAQAFLPGMAQRGFGRLIFVSSDGARAGSGGEGAYAATKAALFGLAKTLARETARYGVTSNVLCPGPTDTPML